MDKYEMTGLALAMVLLMILFALLGSMVGENIICAENKAYHPEVKLYHCEGI